MVKTIRIIGYVGLFCVIFITVVGLIMSYIHKGATGFGRSFGAPEFMVIAIIAVPAIVLIWLAHRLENKRKQEIIKATARR